MFGWGYAVLKRLEIERAYSLSGILLLMDSRSDDGISIPSSYTAYLAPLSTYKLYTEAAGTKEGKERDKAMETLYVVMLQTVNILSGEGGGMSGQCGSRIQECWEFQHPDRSVSRDANGEGLVAKLVRFFPVIQPEVLVRRLAFHEYAQYSISDS